MTIDDMMKLVNAGFNKAEILAITGQSLTPPNPDTVEDRPTPDTVEDTKTSDTPAVDRSESVGEAPKQNTPTNVNFAPMFTDAQVEKLAQLLNRGQASIDLPQNRSTSDILSEHYKDLFKG